MGPRALTKELPEKKSSVIVVKLSKLQRKLYGDFLKLKDKNDVYHDKNVLLAYTTLRPLMNHTGSLLIAHAEYYSGKSKEARKTSARSSPNNLNLMDDVDEFDATAYTPSDKLKSFFDLFGTGQDRKREIGFIRRMKKEKICVGEIPNGQIGIEIELGTDFESLDWLKLPFLFVSNRIKEKCILESVKPNDLIVGMNNVSAFVEGASEEKDFKTR